MPSYTLNNWDGSLLNPQDQTSSQTWHEYQGSPSATIPSRATPYTPQKVEKSSVNGNLIGHMHGFQTRGGESGGLIDPRNGVRISKELGNSNFSLMQENGSPAFAVQTTPLPNGYLSTSTPPQTTFTPILESPLHANKTRHDASVMSLLPFHRSPTSHSPPHPPHENSDEMDSISIYTMDPEGEDEHGDVIIVEDLLTCSPTKSLYSQPQAHAPFVTSPTRCPSPHVIRDSPLFTPPPSESSPMDSLFTPNSAIWKKTRSQKMSHVEVPPLHRPKSDYIVLSNTTPKKAHHLSSRAHFQVHNSLSDAMQAAYSNNEDIGILPSQIVSKKSKERREEDFNALPGPSTLLLSSVVRANKKRSRQHKDEEDYEGGGKMKKRSRILIDLNVSGDERAHRNTKSTSSARTRYEYQRDSLRLYLGVVHSVPVSYLAYNTRFLRNFQSTGKASYRYFIPPKPSVQVNEEVIMSIGDPVAWEEDFYSPVDDGFDDEVVFIEDVARDVTQRSTMHIPRPLSPPKIDLVAEVRKRKTQRDCVSSANPKPTLQSHRNVAPSPSSSTGIHPENHQPNTSWDKSQPQPENVINSMPSAKALGKRKATNPDSSEDLIPSNDIPVHPNSPPPILVIQTQSLARNLDIFLPTYSCSPSPGFAPSSSSYSNLQSSSSLYPWAGTTEDRNPPLIDNSAPSISYQSEILEHLKHSQEKFPSESILNSLEAQSKPSDLWSAVEDETIGQYEGQPMNQDPAEPDPQFDHDPLLLAVQLPSSLHSEPSSSTSHDSPNPSENDYKPSTVTMDFSPCATNRNASRASSASSASTPSRGVRRRRQSQRKLPDMIPIDHLDISDISSSSSGCESSSSSSDVGPESSAIIVSSRPCVITSSQTKPELRKLSELPLQTSQQVWPLEEFESYCHQCRSKSRILKLTCSCSKIFCARCLTFRYPGKFDYAIKQGYRCPYCQKFCNCTACCKKRGETYVSSGRRGGRPKITTMQPPSIRKRVSLGGKSNLPPPSQRPSEPVKYWGAVYSLTGQKIASTFAPQTEEGHPTVVFGLHNSEECR